MTFDASLQLLESQGFLENLFDSIPCGVIVVDEDRRIRAANRVFESAVGLQPGAAIGSCEGAAIGCLNAAGNHDHTKIVVDSGCETCQARQIAVNALELNELQRGRAHFQVSFKGRVEDVTLSLRASPFVFNNGRFAIVIIEDVAQLRRLRPENSNGKMTLGMVGSDPKMAELFDTVRQVGPMDVPVMILGESGTGKELVANALHGQSNRNSGLLVPVNCGALPDGLLESELFGHVKGAFTGAIRNKKGRFLLADRGTIFLDEIGELSPQMQVKFLRVLQNGTFEPVGSETTIEVNARVICATNRDLASEVEAGRFRADLFYRLCVVPITVPPLRERPDDIQELAEHFLKKMSEDTQTPTPGIGPKALERLTRHRWPGNVRELENAIRFAVIKAQGNPIQPRHLPPLMKGLTPITKSATARHRKLNRTLVEEALEATNGNKSQAARHLGVSRATLYRFLSEQSAFH